MIYPGNAGFRFLLIGLLATFGCICLQKACGPVGQGWVGSLSAANPPIISTIHKPITLPSNNRMDGSCLFMDDQVLLDITLSKPDKVKMMIHQVGGQMLYMRHWTVPGRQLKEEIDLSQLQDGVYVLHIQSSTQEMKQVLVL